MKRPLYCECGGLIKLKSKETSINIPHSKAFEAFDKVNNYVEMQMMLMSKSKTVSIYKCSKCGKRY